MSSFLSFLGHFHPVVVHLPIGMIIAALLLQVLAGRPEFAALAPAVAVVLLAGAVSALIACLTGWILSQSGEYDVSLVGWHQWMGISLCLLAFILWVRVRRRGFGRVDQVLAIVVLALVIVTGHLGGSLTHGRDYLSFGAGASGAVAEVDSPILNVQVAMAYREVVRPILRDNCYSCHGATRQKGGLRLDDSAWMMKGGKDGLVIHPGHSDASELIKRLLLPEQEDHHMPPREKKQLNERQIVLLHWWIDQGADFTRRVAELKQPDSVRAALLSVQGARPRVAVSELPEGDVAQADEAVLEKLRAGGVRVMAVAQGSHWLEADLTGVRVAAGGGVSAGGGVAAGAGGSADANAMIRLIPQVRKQLVSLKIDHMGIGDTALSAIGQCAELRWLDLAGNPVGDGGLAALKGLSELRVINLVGTRVSAKGVEGLRGLPKLRALYLYGTRVGSGDWAALRKMFPKVEIDTGGYRLPKLATDTAVVRTKIAAKKL